MNYSKRWRACFAVPMVGPLRRSVPIGDSNSQRVVQRGPRLGVCFLSALMLGPGVAPAQTQPVPEHQQTVFQEYSCSRHQHERLISIRLLPESSGNTCDVRYRKLTELFDHDQILWRASNGTQFCEQKVKELTEKLAQWGWQCGELSVAGGAPAATASGSAGAATSARDSTDVRLARLVNGETFSEPPSKASNPRSGRSSQARPSTSKVVRAAADEAPGKDSKSSPGDSSLRAPTFTPQALESDPGGIRVVPAAATGAAGKQVPRAATRPAPVPSDPADRARLAIDTHLGGLRDALRRRFPDANVSVLGDLLAFGDIDVDGDMDAVVGYAVEINQLGIEATVSVFRNTGANFRHAVSQSLGSHWPTALTVAGTQLVLSTERPFAAPGEPRMGNLLYELADGQLLPVGTR